MLKDLENSDSTHVKVVMASFKTSFPEQDKATLGFRHSNNYIAYYMDPYEFLIQDNNRFLRHTFTHEIFHQLGLKHSDVPNSEGKIPLPNSFMGYERYQISDDILEEALKAIVKKYPHCANQNQAKY